MLAHCRLTLTAAHLIGPVVALVTNAYEDRRTHITVADHAFSVACRASVCVSCGSVSRRPVRRGHGHFSQRRPIAIPGCFLHMTRSGWCFAIALAPLSTSRPPLSSRGSGLSRPQTLE